MYLLLVSERYTDEVISIVPCISNDGVLVVPSDCEQELIDAKIVYQKVKV